MKLYVRRTVVCRNDNCGGGWWGEPPMPLECPRCGRKLTDLALTHVVDLRDEP